MKRGICAALAVLLALALGRETAAGEYGSVARVNGVEISRFRLERHFEDYLRERRRSVAQIRNPSVYQRLRREALEQLIDKELLWQEAVRRGLRVEPAEVERRRTRLAARFADPESFARRLRQAGFDEAGYAEYLRREIAAGRMLEQLAGPLEVDEAEVQRLYLALRAQAPDADAAQQRTLARRLLLERRSAQARQAALERLRSVARIERMP
ncbi:SurA N-terminal domain-containing protein [Pseudomonas stutzeri]|nr:SurA N-terminal domain-containing protein [Stutzerimonas stutzeri]